ncbi:uncharacterized protein EI90DRAFT_3058548 [Cantharellus anzutake]|uniref:uncharacterized protein n=1 Tax=Cantharellus anzutake TaxID=1750568 RepID=UPI00190583CF|nr:uncharacterized protein EI90DRAFT_3058548 [Cantharellus anzutake]KAF8331099.1 hypothetical protein EI90DRAFT_3058548 [Cantharellus anzutake]
MSTFASARCGALTRHFPLQTWRRAWFFPPTGLHPLRCATGTLPMWHDWLLLPIAHPVDFVMRRSRLLHCGLGFSSRQATVIKRVASIYLISPSECL